MSTVCLGVYGYRHVFHLLHSSYTHELSSVCGSFAGKVTGDPQLAVWCHCEQCRKFTGAAMQLAVFADDKIEVTRGDENVNKYQSKPGIFRNSCKTCGAFVYK